MTKQEFTEGVYQLSIFYPNFEPPRRSLDAWYAILQDLPNSVYLAALKLICRTEPRWWPDTNLAALIGKYETDAQGIVTRQTEQNRINDPARMIMEPRLSREEAKIMFGKLYAELGEPLIVKGMP